jgi:hypothetical protein
MGNQSVDDLVEEALHHHIALLESAALLPLDREDRIHLYTSAADWRCDHDPYQVQYIVRPEEMNLEYAEFVTSQRRYRTVHWFDISALRDTLNVGGGPLWDVLSQEVSEPVITRPSRNLEKLIPELLPDIVQMGLDLYWQDKKIEWSKAVIDELERSRKRSDRVINIAEYRKKRL